MRVCTRWGAGWCRKGRNPNPNPNPNPTPNQVGRRLVREGTHRWSGVTMDGAPTTKHKKWSEPEHLPPK